jgi:hypothetical protein
MSQIDHQIDEQKVLGWQSALAWFATGFLILESLTGLAITFLPFSLPLQLTVVIHSAIGIPALLPLSWYLWKHWRRYREATWTYIKVTGYVALISTIVCLISGAVLVYQAVFDTRIGYGWSKAHLISTFAILASAAPHVVFLMGRYLSLLERDALRTAVLQHGRGAVSVLAAGIVMVLAWWPVGDRVSFVNELPEDYVLVYGEDRPFAPSLATTTTGQAIDQRSLSGSESCGRSGCHTQIMEEWQPSAHRYAAMDAAFQAVQSMMADQNGAESTRYCGGCHDPISLFSGTKNVFVENLTNLQGYHEGISCLSCHGIVSTDVRGNANYVVEQHDRYAYELGTGPASVFLSNFLIRAYPKHHVETLSRRLFKSAEFCAACHKQFIDEEINQVGWVQLQNQFDNWRKSRWNHPNDPERTVECRECHMPLVDASQDPASGDPVDYNRNADDGKHRSHRFLGANQFIPTLHNLPGAQEHVDLTEAWLRGEIEIPEIADKWTKGPAVPIRIIAPKQISSGDQVDLRVEITSNKVGHDFPTGPLDIIQAWIELEVRDVSGNIVFASGRRDEGHFIEPGSFMFKAEAVDRYGNLIDRHNLWEMVGVRFRRALFPGFSDAASYTFACPSSMGGEPSDVAEKTSFTFEASQSDRLIVDAKLQYRKVDQYLLNYLMGKDSGATSPVTTISTARDTIQVTAG